MPQTISTRNDLRQPEIFLLEIVRQNRGLVPCLMGKTTDDENREIFLGGWLKLFGLKTVRAAEIAGCSQSYISNISGGRRSDVNALYLLRLSDRLGVTVNDFFVPPPSESDPTSFIDISAKARESVIKRWQQIREHESEKPAKKRAGARR
ncbi:helix-turn-helix domain-containing protein [Pseudorhodoplanes sinuspersici]|nr:helix-turn-helix transcriptional regulator [Pseudorhodoplanes sinuspersici]